MDLQATIKRSQLCAYPLHTSGLCLPHRRQAILQHRPRAQPEACTGQTAGKSIEMPNGTWWLDKASHSHDVVYGQVCVKHSTSATSKYSLLASSASKRLGLSTLAWGAELCASASTAWRAGPRSEPSLPPLADSSGGRNNRLCRFGALECLKLLFG